MSKGHHKDLLTRLSNFGLILLLLINNEMMQNGIDYTSLSERIQ